MKIKHYYYSVIIFLIVFFSCCNKEKSQSDYEQLVVNKINTLTENNLNIQIKNQNVYFGLDSLKIIDLKQAVKQHKFFLYFSSETCTPCIRQTIDLINKVFPRYKNDNKIIFISPDYPVRLKENCYGKKLLTLKDETIGIPLEQENVPFLFTLSDDLKINNLHIVNKNDFQKLFDFLKKLKNNK
jgi:aryl carrier-like protein